MKTFSDLRGKHVLSVQGATDSNKPVVERVLSHLGLGPDDLVLSESSIADAEPALVQKKADALVFVAPPAGTKIRELVTNLAKAKTPLSFIDLPSAGAITARFPYLQSITVPAGVFGGIPARPPENLESVAITYELVASRVMSDRRAAALTKSLQSVRVKNAAADGAPFAIEAPPTDQIRRFMPHAGTKAYLDDDTKTLLETYSDHIWFALFGFSLIGSSVTGLLAWTGLRKPPESAGLLHGLPALIDRVSSARTISELDAVQAEFDKIVATSLREYASGALDEDDSDRPVWLNQMQSLIEHQRERVHKGQTSDPSWTVEAIASVGSDTTRSSDEEKTNG